MVGSGSGRRNHIGRARRRRWAAAIAIAITVRAPWFMTFAAASGKVTWTSIREELIRYW